MSEPVSISPAPTTLRRLRRPRTNPRRRHLPGRALAALDAGVSRTALRALPRARRTNPSPFIVLLQLRPVPDSSARLARDPRAGSSAGKVTIRAHRRHPQARRHTRGGPRAGARPAVGPKRNWPSTSCCSTSAATTWARVAKIGTVQQPTEEFIVERYSHVMHIVSNGGGRAARGSRCAVGRCWPVCPRARGGGGCRARPRCARCRSSTKLEPEKRGVLRRRRGVFQRRRRHGHVHRAAHGRGEGRQALHPGGRRRGLTTATPKPNSRNREQVARDPTRGRRRGAVSRAGATADA